MNRFLYFSRGQQIGIIVLLTLIVAAIALNALLPYLLPAPADENDSTFVAEVAAFEQSLRDKPRPTWQSPFEARPIERTYTQTATQPTELFDFDPNTLDSANFVRLGLKPYVVERIMNFRNSDKRFRTAEFFVNFCHLSAEQSERLLPYVHIADTPQRDLQPTAATSKKEYIHIELNAADTATLKQMPGIGSGRAKQIVGYRQQLGGFAHSKQLLEIRNFPPDLYDKIAPYLSVDLNGITKIKVNKASVERLKSHPYLNFYQAKAIYELRRANGVLTNIDELKHLSEFAEYDFKKLEPYLDFGEVKYEYKRK
ncbi:MAG: ComEA family DNA-binding protein [Paludibacteraceae bacterium]